MFKYFLTLAVAISLYADTVGAIAVIVKDKVITLYDIKREMQITHANAQVAQDNLIRKKLEEIEIEERNLNVDTSEVYEDIRETARKNNMSVSEFYAAVLESNGLNSEDLKEQIRHKLLTMKLYSAISFSGMQQPTDADIQEYYNLHKDEFSKPISFDVVIYEAMSQNQLLQKMQNPMFYSPQITSRDEVIDATKTAPGLAQLLARTPARGFSQIVPNGQGGFMSFYVKEAKKADLESIDSVRDEITNIIMGQNRELTLQDYFAKAKETTDIKVIRNVN